MPLATQSASQSQFMPLHLGARGQTEEGVRGALAAQERTLGAARPPWQTSTPGQDVTDSLKGWAGSCGPGMGPKKLGWS